MDNHTQYLQQYIPFIDFLAEVLGKNSEIVLHNLKDLDSSIVAIRNNHITKRQVGDPATDYVLRMIQQGIDDNKDFSTNYRDISNRNNQKVKSASLYLRNKGEIVGMICVNTDVTLFEEIEKSVDALELLLGTYQNNKERNKASKETVSRSVEEMADNIVMELAIKKGISINQFKQDDKYDAIEKLFDNGFFLLKGAVPEASRVLKISEPTVYRYLQNVKSYQE
ncbi:transcriptional regulator [Erysipelothrix urinaevulpis]|uniref:helix-turn-helix transcriptional regulator n=1 Tax=Erysipelothrix urinaevulpis TaxID=2683717 RepID=UPI001359CF3B|nr:PAS domain-containing protein [Erysipelothrix urinaevulpis]